MISPAWIGADWGTSNLRLWAVSTNGQIVAQAHSARGMSVLKPDEFEATLLDLVAPWLISGEQNAVPTYLCGMVGARQGWIETPYRSVPCAPVPCDGLLAAPLSPQARQARLQVSIVPGLSQSAPPDVMRGEETQVAGWLATCPGDSGVLCLPGTHSKWVVVEAGEIVRFSSFMTGELFGLLRTQSVLRHSLPDPNDALAAPDESFLQSVVAAATDPHRGVSSLFGIRASTLLPIAGPAGDADSLAKASLARLSGLLIGQELGATRALWQDRPVTLIASPALAVRYGAALESLGASVQSIDPVSATLAGLSTAAGVAFDRSCPWS